jgi:hypothetical protein
VCEQARRCGAGHDRRRRAKANTIVFQTAGRTAESRRRPERATTDGPARSARPIIAVGTPPEPPNARIIPHNRDNFITNTGRPIDRARQGWRGPPAKLAPVERLRIPHTRLAQRGMLLTRAALRLRPSATRRRGRRTRAVRHD